MSIDTVPPTSAAVENGQSGVQGLENGVASLKMDATAQQQQSQEAAVDGQAQGQAQQTSPQPAGEELELHRACAGGNVEEVRAVLSRGLDQLEHMGK
jgi:hypothetical protein